jgi:hypothetical protein
LIPRNQHSFLSFLLEKLKRQFLMIPVYVGIQPGIHHFSSGLIFQRLSRGLLSVLPLGLPPNFPLALLVRFFRVLVMLPSIRAASLAGFSLVAMRMSIT